MATNSAAKGNPAAKRMLNPNNKAKRVRNHVKNEVLRKLGKHPKQLREKANSQRHLDNLQLVGQKLGWGEARYYQLAEPRNLRKVAKNLRKGDAQAFQALMEKWIDN